MKFVFWLFRLALVVAAALAGNFVGACVRDPALDVDLNDVGSKITPMNLLPSLALTWLLGRPRTVGAFLSGAVVAVLLGDTLERGV